MILRRLLPLVTQSCWFLLGVLVLGSLGLMALGGAQPWEIVAWAPLAAVAVASALRAMAAGGDDRAGVALVALAACGGSAVLTSPRLAPLPLGLAVAWGSLALLWHQVVTVQGEVLERGPGLTAEQEVLLAGAATTRLGAVVLGTFVAGGLAVGALMFALFPLEARGTLGTLLILFASILGIGAGFYIGLKWYLQRRGASGKSG